MRRYHELSTDLYAQVLANKQISRLQFTEAEFKSWLHTIDIINGLPEEQRFFGTYEISQYVIPQKFSVLLHPTRVTYSGNRQDPDLLVRYPQPASSVVGPESGQDLTVVFIDNVIEFNEMSRLIGGALKDSCVSISRPGETTLANVRQKLALEDKVYSTSIPFIPLPVKPEVGVIFGIRYMIVEAADEHVVYSVGEFLSGRSNGGQAPPGTQAPQDNGKSVALNHGDGVTN